MMAACGKFMVKPNFTLPRTKSMTWKVGFCTEVIMVEPEKYSVYYTEYDCCSSEKPGRVWVKDFSDLNEAYAYSENY